MALDISAVGCVFELSGGGKSVTITEWSDEGTPFDCPDLDISENRKNLNGTMISSRTPSVVPVAITVIPGSVSDKKLNAIFSEQTLSPTTKERKVAYYDGTLTIPSIVQGGSDSGQGEVAGKRIYKFKAGRPKSYPGGPSTSAEGRLSSRTYTFEFESCEPA